MEKLSYLPPEIIELILPYVGGFACLSLRRACKRLKMMIDQMEMTLKPCIWYRYIYQDFSKPCIESVMPWIKENCEGGYEENNIVWKTVYSNLCCSKKRHKVFISKQINMSSSQWVPGIIMFAGAQLFIYCQQGLIVCVGVRDRCRNELLMPITESRYLKDNELVNRVSFQSLLTKQTDSIIYKPFNINDQTNPVVEHCKQMVRSSCRNHSMIDFSAQFIRCARSIDITQRALIKLRSFAEEKLDFKTWTSVLYDSEMVLGASDNTIFICHHYSSGSDSGASHNFVCSHSTLPHQIKSLHRLGNLLIVVAKDTFNNVFTNVMGPDAERGRTVTMGTWQQLCLRGGSNQVIAEGVCDVDILGYALVLVTVYGKVFFSTVEDPSHEAIQGNLYLCHEMQDRSLQRTNYWIALDLNNGVVIAILDQYRNVTLLFSE